MIRNTCKRYIYLMFLVFISFSLQAQNIVDGAQLKLKQENGVYIYYDANGNLFTGRVYGKIPHIDSKQKDTFLKIDTAYIYKGKRDKLWKFYYDDGQLWEMGKYKDGRAEGLWKFYYSNGQLLGIGNLKDSKEDGLWKFYYDNGKLSIIGKYKDGKRDGTWRFYNKSAKLYNTRKYKNGKRVE